MEPTITYLDLQIYLGEKEIRTYSEGKFNLDFTESVGLNDLKLTYMKFIYLRKKFRDKAKTIQNINSIDEALEAEEPNFPDSIKRFHKRNEALVVKIARRGFYELCNPLSKST